MEIDKTFRLKEGHRACDQSLKAGTTCYRLAGWDYGLSADDTQATGIPHVSMTLNADGSYPSFTVPEADLIREVV